MYSLYNQKCVETNCEPVGKSKFQELKPKSIKKIKLRDGLCIYCKNAYNQKNELKTILQQLHKSCSSACNKDENCKVDIPNVTKVKIEEIQKELSKYNEHKKLFEAQDVSYNQDLKKLDENDCLIIQDFSSKLFTSYSINESQQEW